ncbi:MerR family DNA-binding transcriptional regulator [Microbispora sp. NPDC049633]
MTIAHVAQRTGLTAHTLRHYERAGLLLHRRRITGEQ